MGTGRTHRALWDAVVGATAALLVFGAVPGVLVGLVGLPVPDHWSDHDVVSWHGLFDLLAIVSWCAWAACAWPVLRSVAARVRSGDVDAAARLSDRIAVRITLGILTLSSFLGLGVSMAGASVARASLPVSSPAVSARAAPPRVVSPHAVTPGRLQEAATVGRPSKTASCVVGPGDTLPDLAAARYGDASDWPAIASANLGRLMDDGTRFVDPVVIAPGWTLLLPELDAESRTDEGAVRPASLDRADSRTPADELSADRFGSDGVLPLAELGAAGLSALVAGLLARRTKQLRRLRAFLREEGEASPVPEEREADLGAPIAPFKQVPLVEMIEVAARDLGGAFATLEPAPGPVQWLRAGRDGVEVRFSEPVPQDVHGWRRTGHAAWLLPATLNVAERRSALVSGEPWCPALLPLGDDDRGTWLLPLEAGSSLAVVGPRAADFVLAMRAAVAMWSWHEELVVTEGVDEATGALGRAVRAPTGIRTIASPVLFVGDPDALSSETRRACAVLTTRQVDAEVTVFVDDRAASAHPLGLSVRPPLIGASWKGAVDALAGARGDGAAPSLLDGSSGPGTATPGDPGNRGPARSLVHRHPPPVTLRVAERGTGPGTTAQPDIFSSVGPSTPGDGPRATAAARTRGRVEVRLLATLPGIVGLQAELPAKRARRALELIAYLAMSAPDPVTGATFQRLTRSTFQASVSGCGMQ